MKNGEKNSFNVFNIYILISEYKLKTNCFKQVMKVTSGKAKLEENCDREILISESPFEFRLTSGFDFW